MSNYNKHKYKWAQFTLHRNKPSLRDIILIGLCSKFAHNCHLSSFVSSPIHKNKPLNKVVSDKVNVSRSKKLEHFSEAALTPTQFLSVSQRLLIWGNARWLNNYIQIFCKLIITILPVSLLPKMNTCYKHTWDCQHSLYAWFVTSEMKYSTTASRQQKASAGAFLTFQDYHIDDSLLSLKQCRIDCLLSLNLSQSLRHGQSLNYSICLRNSSRQLVIF